MSEQKTKIIVYIDGLCEPQNPFGVASYGFVIYKGEEKIYEESKIIGEGAGMSNNVAEYSALTQALKWLLKNHLINEEIIVRSDSRLLVNQMTGWWEAHGGLYYNVYAEALRLAQNFSKISFAWIPREQNVEADGLSRKAYEEYCKAKGVTPRYHREAAYDFKPDTCYSCVWGEIFWTACRVLQKL